MTAPSDRQTAEADLAFLRSIVQGGGRPSFTLAVVYLAGGLLYGVQCLFHIGQAWGLIRWPDLANLAFVISITAAMLGIIVWAVLKDRRDGTDRSGSTASRAMSAALSGAGWVNAAMVIIFGVNASRDGDFSIWLYYPAMVFGLQAAAWYMAWSLRRQTWMLMTALGGWITAVALGLLVHQSLIYLYVCTAALFLLFAVPGWIMLRQVKAAEREA